MKLFASLNSAIVALIFALFVFRLIETSKVEAQRKRSASIVNTPVASPKIRAASSSARRAKSMRVASPTKADLSDEFLKRLADSQPITVRQLKIIEDAIIKELANGPIKKDSPLVFTIEKLIKNQTDRKLEKDVIRKILNCYVEPDWKRYRTVLVAKARAITDDSAITDVQAAIDAEFGEMIPFIIILKHMENHWLDYIVAGRPVSIEEKETEKVFVGLIERFTINSKNNWLISINKKYPDEVICENESSLKEHMGDLTADKEIQNRVCRHLAALRIREDEWNIPTYPLSSSSSPISSNAQTPLNNSPQPAEGGDEDNDEDMDNKKISTMTDKDDPNRPITYFRPPITFVRGIRPSRLLTNSIIMLSMQNRCMLMIENFMNRERLSKKLFHTTVNYNLIRTEIVKKMALPIDYLRFYLQFLRYSYRLVLSQADQPFKISLFSETFEYVDNNSASQIAVDGLNFAYRHSNSAAIPPKILSQVLKLMSMNFELACPNDLFECANQVAIHYINELLTLLRLFFSRSESPILPLMERLKLDFELNSFDILKHSELRKLYDELDATKLLVDRPKLSSPKLRGVRQHASKTFHLARALIQDAIMSSCGLSIVERAQKMCGIFAYLNHHTVKKRSEIVEILIQGLSRMEYRGYDSAGIAVDGPKGGISLFRQPGKVDVLNKFVQETDALNSDTPYDVHCGIAHTRWATHGSPSDLNAHPQRSNADGDFLVVHNGIVTNYNDIKTYLRRKGHTFESETDTEVIAKLTQHIFQRFPGYSFRELVEATVQQLEGAFALAFKSRHFPNQLVATRRGSPLLIGIKSESRISASHFPISFSKESGWLWYNDAKKRAASRSDTTVDFDHSLRSFADDDFAVELLKDASMLEDDAIIGPVDAKNTKVEYFVASDASAIIEHTRQVIFLEDDDVAFVEGGALSIHRIRRDTDADGGAAGQLGGSREVQQLNLELQQIMRGDFRTFMQKEIHEQPDSVVNTMRGRVLADGRVVLGGIKNFIGDIKRCRRLIMIACGTSYNSANACRQIIEELTELPVILELASDFLDRQTPIFRDDVCFCISQSGETADTLNALRYCKLNGSLIIGITNTVGSSICRESHCGIHINAGPEIGVASTKAYTSQILALLMFALSLSDDRISLRDRRAQIVAEMGQLSDRIREVLKLDEQVKAISKKICQQQSILIMGRGYNFATCLEGALKIKELSYLHCEGVLSGELKHGPLAMVDEKLCILMIICNDHVYKKSLNALQQVLARGGRPIVIADETVPAGDLPEQIEHVLRVPKTVDCLQNILTVIPFQLFSLHIAELNNRDVDRPRNLAKSVTVE